MNKTEARLLLDEYLSNYIRRSYQEFEQLVDHPTVAAIEGPSGTHYNIEVQVFWDDVRGGNLRLSGSIDDGGIRAFAPFTTSYIIGPTGEVSG